MRYHVADRAIPGEGSDGEIPDTVPDGVIPVPGDGIPDTVPDGVIPVPGDGIPDGVPDGVIPVE